jgi:hypothetical protein
MLPSERGRRQRVLGPKRLQNGYDRAIVWICQRPAGVDDAVQITIVTSSHPARSVASAVTCSRLCATIT